MKTPLDPVSVSEVVSSLRRKEAGLRKRHGVEGEKFTYWDCDDLRLMMRLEGIDALKLSGIGPKFGYKDIIVCIDVKKHEPSEGVLLVDCAQLLDILLVGEDMFSSAMLGALSEFPGSQVQVTKCDRSEAIMTYCRRVDEEIVSSAFALRKAGVKGIFEKMVKEMAVKSQDHQWLPKRVNYYGKISNLFQKDRDKWKFEMTMLGLIK